MYLQKEVITSLCEKGNVQQIHASIRLTDRKPVKPEKPDAQSSKKRKRSQRKQSLGKVDMPRDRTLHNSVTGSLLIGVAQTRLSLSTTTTFLTCPRSPLPCVHYHASSSDRHSSLHSRAAFPASVDSTLIFCTYKLSSYNFGVFCRRVFGSSWFWALCYRWQPRLPTLHRPEILW
jgi:hypothetical protein